jgi:hypothetical protein
LDALEVASGSAINRLSSLETASGSAITRLSSLETASGSAITRLSSLETASGSAITRLDSLETASGSAIGRLNALETASGSAITRLISLENRTGSYATTGSNTFVGSQYFSSSFNPTGFTTTASLYTDGGLRVTKDMYVSGTAYFNNITVFGTQSVAYISSSQLNIGTNIITVNTDTPTIRFGGLAVYDSGSTGLTGSILWDSQNNHWVYTNPSGSSYSGGMLISGPRASSLGSEQGTTSNALMKGQGGDHITSSGIFESGSGNVGIGTSVPAYKLDVVGTGYFSGNLSSAGQLRLEPSAGGSIVVGSRSSQTDFQLYNTGNVFRIYDGSRDALNVNTSGNVGIGTTSPSAPLEIYGTSGDGTPTFKVTSTAAVGSFNWAGTILNSSLSSSRNYILLIGQAASTKNSGYIGYNHSGTGGSDSNFLTFGHFGSNNLVNINGLGNVGIGTTAPGQTLAVNGSAYVGNLSTTLNFTGGGGARFLEIGASGADALLVTHASGYGVGYFGYSSADDRLVVACDNGGGANKIDFIVNAGGTTGGATNNLSGVAPAVRITSSGSVGIGTTAPGWKLHVEGTTGTSIQDPLLSLKVTTANNTSGILFINSGNTASFNDLAGIYARIYSGNAKGYLGFYTRNSDGDNSDVAERMRIISDGNVGIGTGTPAYKLDVSGSGRFTENIITSGGNVGIGTTSPSTLLHMVGASATLIVADSTSYATGVGGKLSLHGNYRSAGDITEAGYIKASKVNSTNGDYGFDMIFATHNYTAGVAERLRISSTGAATFASSISAASAGISSTSITTTASTTLLNSRGIIVDAATTTNAAFVPIGFSWASSVSDYNPYWGMALRTLSYNAGTADLVFYTAGNIRLTIGSSGGATFSSSVTAESLRINNNSNLIGNGRRIFGNDDADNYYIGDIGGTGGLTINWYGGIIMRTLDTERMRITSGGNVGIGTTAPSNALSVGANAHTSPSDTNRILNFYSVGTELHNSVIPLVVGNNNISTSQPTMVGLSLFNRSTTANTWSPMITFGGLSTSGDYMNGAAGIAAQLPANTDNNFRGGNLVFYTAGTVSGEKGLLERMRINSSGHITKPYQPAFKAGMASSVSVGASATIIFPDTSGNHFNIGGHYNTTTGLFTAPVAGVYVFSACVIYESMSAGQTMDDAFYIYKNATLVAYSFRRAEYEAGYTGNGGYYVDHANVLLNLAASDTVKVVNNRALSVHGNTNYCFFYGYMLG